MKEKYNGYCMEFTNEELKKYILEYMLDNLWDGSKIRFLSENDEEIKIDSSEKIETISFDDEDNVAIIFFGCQTSIFAYDLEIMFIDESVKGTYTSSDVQDNVVYEGDLRDLTHEEMLKMFADIILCFRDAMDVHMEQRADLEGKYRRYRYYEPKIFVVDVINGNAAKCVRTYENITIQY